MYTEKGNLLKARKGNKNVKIYGFIRIFVTNCYSQYCISLDIIKG